MLTILIVALVLFVILPHTGIVMPAPIGQILGLLLAILLIVYVVGALGGTLPAIH